MARYKACNPDQSLLLPVTLKNHIYPGSLEETIDIMVEKHLDLTLFDQIYHNNDTGRLAYHPKVLLKVILLAYSRGIIGSRRIEQACRENILFMALAGGHHPDHSTIAAFVNSMKDFILDFFVQILMVCSELNLLDGTHFSLDGCKLPSNASKEHSATFKELKKKRGKLKEKLKGLLSQHIVTDKNDEDIREVDKSKRERRIKRIEKQIKRIDSFLNENNPKQGRTKKEIQSNITDNDSAKMPTAHGVIQGYNAQVMVDSKHQIIVHAEAMGNGQDADNLKPMVEGLKQNLKTIGNLENPVEGTILTADSNYHTNENIDLCEQEAIDAYIPDTNFRKRDANFKDQKRFRDGVNKPPKKKGKFEKFSPDDFIYDKKNDGYICPQGQLLHLITNHMVNRGTIYRVFRIKNDACQNCLLRDKCLANKSAKQRYLLIPIETDENVEKPVSPSARMKKKIDSKHGKEIYSHRLGNVEPVFGNIRYNKLLNRFTYRTKVKVNTQWLLYCLIHNIEKISRYGFAN